MVLLVYREVILVCIIGNVGNTGIGSNVYLEVFQGMSVISWCRREGN